MSCRYVDHLRAAHGETRHVCKFCAKLFKLKGSLLVRGGHGVVVVVGCGGVTICIHQQQEDGGDYGDEGVVGVTSHITRLQRC